MLGPQGAAEVAAAREERPGPSTFVLFGLIAVSSGGHVSIWEARVKHRRSKRTIETTEHTLRQQPA